MVPEIAEVLVNYVVLRNFDSLKIPGQRNYFPQSKTSLRQCWGTISIYIGESNPELHWTSDGNHEKNSGHVF
jgi:hypothetical protein